MFSNCLHSLTKDFQRHLQPGLVCNDLMFTFWKKMRGPATRICCRTLLLLFLPVMTTFAGRKIHGFELIGYTRNGEAVNLVITEEDGAPIGLPLPP